MELNVLELVGGECSRPSETWRGAFRVSMPQHDPPFVSSGRLAYSSPLGVFHPPPAEERVIAF